MNSIQSIFTHYQKRFQSLHHYGSELPTPDDKLKLAVSIPAFQEDLAATFESLGRCNLTVAEEVEVVLVLNNSVAASHEVAVLHQKQLEYWNGKVLDNGLKILTIWANDLPNKQAGVGLARKIAMDVCLHRFSQIGYNGFIQCLDGDCTVNENYLEALLIAEQTSLYGLTARFEHQWEGLPIEREKAIVRYEIFLRYYVEALKWAKYPHAYHTIGSCMGVRAGLYGKLGGMNKRKAGEDFYFLHKLIPQGKFMQVNKAMVFPSSRNSERVPFGTGRAMLEMENGTKSFERLYHPKIFYLLKEIHQNIENPPVCFFEFLKNENWLTSYQGLKDRSQNQDQFLRNFFFWWDGFKVLKFVHRMQDKIAPLPILEAATLLDLSLKSATPKGLLDKLRMRQ